MLIVTLADYDFICKNTSYEIKADRMAYKTNNVAIEYKCNNKPSGISSTKSKYYIYFIVKPDNTHTAYMIPTDDIKKLIEDKQYHRNIRGGDGYRAQMYLFKINLFNKYINELI